MAPPISQTDRTWLYITWPATFVVHVLQIRCMPAQPRSLQCSIFLFAILTLSFFGGFAACDTVNAAGQASDAAFGLFTTLEIVCMIHVIFLQVCRVMGRTDAFEHAARCMHVAASADRSRCVPSRET